MERLEYFLNPDETSVVVVRFQSSNTALVAIDREAVYLLGMNPTRGEARRAGDLLRAGNLSIYAAHGIFPLAKVSCCCYTVV